MSTSHTDQRPIGLLSDFGPDSFYVGAMKAAMLSINPRSVLVDITHAVPSYAIDEASFILSRCLDVFPRGSVLLCVVDPGVGGKRMNLIVEAHGRMIVGPDNGIVSDVAVDYGLEGCYEIDEARVASLRGSDGRGHTFLGRDVFAPVAAALAAGAAVSEFAAPVEDLFLLDLPAVETGSDFVRGQARHVDGYGNVLTNISGAQLSDVFGGFRREHVRAELSNGIEIVGLRSFFAEGHKGELLLLENSWGLIELAVNGGSAVDALDDLHNLIITLSMLDG